MHKKAVYLMMVLSVMLLCEPLWAMGNKAGGGKSAAQSAVDTANSLGNNDAVQQAAGDAGEAIFKAGGKQFGDAIDYMNNGVNTDRVQNMAKNGTNIALGGKALELTGKAAPHVGWVATSAGRAAEGDYTGAAIEGANGAARTVIIGKLGTAAGTAGGIWVAGKLGAVAGSWAGPLGAGAGFVIGMGAAYVGGKIWDSSIGKGADALDQKIKDCQSHSQYAGDPDRSGARQNVRQIQQGSKPSRPAASSRPGGCTCP